MTNIKRTRTIAFAVLIAGGAGYAAAQQAQPKTQQPAAQPQGQNADTANACGENCSCMHGGMMGGGQNRMMMGCKGSMADMGGMAEITVENTKKGALIHMNARKPEQVAQLQQMAQRMMTSCSGNEQPAAAPATPKPAR